MIDLSKVTANVKKARAQGFALQDYLFDKQLAFVTDPSPFKIAVTTRRAGKTVACAVDLLHTALAEPELTVLYITLSRNNAKKLVWREIKTLNRRLELGVSFNEAELMATCPNGSVIYCSGAADRTEIEKFRGMSFKKVYIDECQSFPPYIEELIDEVLGPALMDYAGSLILIGTPGPVPTGYFYECSRSDNWTQHYWQFWDNPFIPGKAKMSHQDIFDRELKRRGVSADHPSIQREWFGLWKLDTDSLVYHYDAGKNHYETLPKEKLTYILGVDLGYNDADALAVLAWSDSSPNTYLVDERVSRKQTITELVGQIEELRKKYDISKIVVDTGGLGKKIAEEMSRRYKIACIPAEKVRKVEYIELMNDAMRTGTLLAKANSRYAQDCMKVEWDRAKSTPDKKVISSRFHSDICEAVLYAWRESYSFTHSPEAPKPPYGSKQWSDEEAQRLEEQAEQYFTEQEEASKGFGDFGN